MIYMIPIMITLNVTKMIIPMTMLDFETDARERIKYCIPRIHEWGIFFLK